MGKRVVPPDALAARAKFAARKETLRKYEELKIPYSCFWYNELLLLNEKLLYVSHQEKYEQSLQILERMRLHNIAPDSMTYALVIRAAAYAKLPLEAERHFAEMVQYGSVLPTHRHFHALMKAWCTVNRPHEVERIFRQMASEGMSPQAESFNILLSSCQHTDSAADIVLRQMPEALVEGELLLMSNELTNLGDIRF
jgi:pentatricopeptide repeat protein